MPDYFDVCRLDVRATDPAIPIEWQTLPDLEWEDSNSRQIRSRNYVNEPADATRFELADGYSLPSGWTYRGGGRLNYAAILGQTIALKFTARRDGVPDVDSNEFTITRRQAFIARLVPNRIFVGAAFNDTLGRIYVYNSTDLSVTPVRRWISSFNTEGTEQLSESIEVADVDAYTGSGVAWDGTRFWTCGRDSILSRRNLTVINTDGTQHEVYDYTGGYIESIAYDGSAMWGLDISQRQLRKFSLAGVEDTDATITLPRATTTADMEGFYFGVGQHGLTWGDGHWWIPQFHITGHHYVFCADTDGNAVSSRHFEVPFDVGTIVGVAFQASQDNIWYILDGEDDEGNRFGVIEVQHI